jgi:hypothetical protein
MTIASSRTYVGHAMLHDDRQAEAFREVVLLVADGFRLSACRP